MKRNINKRKETKTRPCKETTTGEQKNSEKWCVCVCETKTLKWDFFIALIRLTKVG